MKKRTWASLAMAMVCATSLRAAVQEPGSARAYEIRGHGRLALVVPPGFVDSQRPAEKLDGVELTFVPPHGDAFLLQVTAVWLNPAEIAGATPEAVRAQVAARAKGPAQRSVEKEAVISELRGAQVRGYYYSLTDSNPPPEEYKYLTQGTLVAGELLTMFTLLQREIDPAGKGRVFEMLAGATYAKAPRSARADAIEITKRAGAFELTFAPSQLTLVVPSEGLSAVDESSSGNGPSYFHLEGRESGMVLSGWFEPAHRFTDVKTFWQGETEGWKRGGLPEPVYVEFAEIGGWRTVIYDIPIPRGHNSHIRAHWLEAGTWIDLHLSATVEGTRSEARYRLQSLLERVRVRLN